MMVMMQGGRGELWLHVGDYGRSLEYAAEFLTAAQVLAYSALAATLALFALLLLKLTAFIKASLHLLLCPLSC